MHQKSPKRQRSTCGAASVLERAIQLRAPGCWIRRRLWADGIELPQGVGLFVSVGLDPLVELTPCSWQAFVGTAVDSARHLCCGQLAQLHASCRFNWCRDLHAQFKLEDVRDHLCMMRKDRADRFHALGGKSCHQLADGGAEHFYHLVSRNSEMNDGRQLSC